MWYYIIFFIHFMYLLIYHSHSQGHWGAGAIAPPLRIQDLPSTKKQRNRNWHLQPLDTFSGLLACPKCICSWSPLGGLRCSPYPLQVGRGLAAKSSSPTLLGPQTSAWGEPCPRLMLHSIGLGNWYLLVSPVGNIVPLKSEMLYFQVGNSEFCETPTSDSEIRVGKYEFSEPNGMQHNSRLCPCVVVWNRTVDSQCFDCYCRWLIFSSWRLQLWEQFPTTLIRGLPQKHCMVKCSIVFRHQKMYVLQQPGSQCSSAQIFACDSIYKQHALYAIAHLSLSVGLSHGWLSQKWLFEVRIMELSPQSSQVPLFFVV